MSKHIVSLGLAFEGIRYSFRTQPNFKIHILAAILVVIFGFLFKITHLEWIVITFMIIIVFIAEMINTAIESMTDLITSEYRRSAKIAKDVSAGVVLITVIGSVVVGLIIFLPRVILTMVS